VNDRIDDIVVSYLGSELGHFKGFSMAEFEVNFIASEFPRFFSNSSQIFQDSDLIVSIMCRKQPHFLERLPSNNMQFFNQILLCYVVTIFNGGKTCLGSHDTQTFILR
jgi:hypothetical protein